MGDFVGDQWGGGEKGKKGKKRKRKNEEGTFRVPGDLLFRIQEEAQAHLRAALEEGDEGDDGDDEDDEGDGADDKGKVGAKGGEEGGEKDMVSITWHTRNIHGSIRVKKGVLGERGMWHVQVGTNV